MVSASVVHTVGPRNCTNGGWLTRRGAGTPGRPPHVWRNTAEVTPQSGCDGTMSGNAVGWKRMRFGPILAMVELSNPPPVWPAATILPSSTTTQPSSRLANRKRPARGTAGRSWGGRGGAWPWWVPRRPTGGGAEPLIASDGIQESEVTDEV